MTGVMRQGIVPLILLLAITNYSIAATIDDSRQDTQLTAALEDSPVKREANSNQSGADQAGKY